MLALVKEVREEFPETMTLGQMCRNDEQQLSWERDWERIPV